MNTDEILADIVKRMKRCRTVSISAPIDLNHLFIRSKTPHLMAESVKVAFLDNVAHGCMYYSVSCKKTSSPYLYNEVPYYALNIYQNDTDMWMCTKLKKVSE